MGHHRLVVVVEQLGVGGRAVGEGGSENIGLEAVSDDRAGTIPRAVLAGERRHDARRVELRSRQRHRERVEEGLPGKGKGSRRDLVGPETLRPGGDLVDAVDLLRQGVPTRQEIPATATRCGNNYAGIKPRQDSKIHD